MRDAGLYIPRGEEELPADPTVIPPELIIAGFFYKQLTRIRRFVFAAERWGRGVRDSPSVGEPSRWARGRGYRPGRSPFRYSGIRSLFAGQEQPVSVAVEGAPRARPSWGLAAVEPAALSSRSRRVLGRGGSCSIAYRRIW